MKTAFLWMIPLSLIGVETGAASTATKPNIIIINCDDMGYGDLSCFGSPTTKTPNLDRMALEGQKWSSFYVSASVSSPSRAGLLTGRLGVRTGMYGDKKGVLFPDSPGGFPAKELTITELLKQAGYETACIGKWHLGHLSEYMPLQHGFDYFYGVPFSNDMSRKEQIKLGNKNYPYELVVYEQDKEIEREPDQTQLTKRLTEVATKYIRSHQKSPFFLYLAHPMPHFPVYASTRFQGVSDRGKYGDTIEELDWSVGEILQTLRQLGLDKNTWVVFTSDNGPWLSYKQAGGSAGPLRDGKNSHCEGGFRVPCIMWGGMVKPGHITQMGSSLDLLPTCCEMVGVNLPAGIQLDGVSLLNVLQDNLADSKREEFFFYRGSLLYAVRKGKYKLHYMNKSYYVPFEHTICISKYWSWFGKKDPQPCRDLDELEELFYWCTDNQNTLVMNIPPDQTGRIREHEANTIISLGKRLGLSSGKPLPTNGVFRSLNAPVTASSFVTDKDGVHEGSQAVDGGMQTYWASKDTTASLTITLNPQEAFNKLSIFECCDVEASEDGFTNKRTNRIQAYRISILNDGEWKLIYVGDEPMDDCKVIKFPHAYQAEQIRLDILQASAPPRIYEFHVIQCEERN